MTRLSHFVPLQREAKLVDVPLTLKVRLARPDVSLLKRTELQRAVELKSSVPLTQAVAFQRAVTLTPSGGLEMSVAR
jgi:hypothetical protein